jgi:hypothetical protein
MKDKEKGKVVMKDKVGGKVVMKDNEEGEGNERQRRR